MHSAQVHVYVEETAERIIYHLLKHPMYPVRREQEDKPDRRVLAYTPPLSFFLDGLDR